MMICKSGRTGSCAIIGPKENSQVVEGIHKVAGGVEALRDRIETGWEANWFPAYPLEYVL